MGLAAGIRQPNQPSEASVQFLNVERVAGGRDILDDRLTWWHYDFRACHVGIGELGVQDFVARGAMMGQQIEVACVNIEARHIVIDITEPLPGHSCPAQCIERRDIGGDLITDAVSDYPQRVRGAGPRSDERDIRRIDVHIRRADTKDQPVLIRWGAQDMQICAAVEVAVCGSRSRLQLLQPVV